MVSLQISGEVGDPGRVGQSGRTGGDGHWGPKGNQGLPGLPGRPGVPGPPLPRYPPSTPDIMYIPVAFHGKVPRTMCHHIRKQAYGEYCYSHTLLQGTFQTLD